MDDKEIEEHQIEMMKEQKTQMENSQKWYEQAKDNLDLGKKSSEASIESSDLNRKLIEDGIETEELRRKAIEKNSCIEDLRKQAHEAVIENEDIRKKLLYAEIDNARTQKAILDRSNSSDAYRSHWVGVFTASGYSSQLKVLNGARTLEERERRAIVREATLMWDEMKKSLDDIPNPSGIPLVDPQKIQKSF